MARKAKAPRRRRSSGVKLLNIAEGFVQANIVTESLMDTSALEFVLGDTGIGNMVSGSGISLIEIARRPELLSVIGTRAMNPQNIINIAVKSALANFGFKFARRAVSRPVRLINKQLRALNLGVTL
jgi:hypothetical protein